MDLFCYVLSAEFFIFGLALCWDDMRDWPQYFRTIAIEVRTRMLRRGGITR